MALVIRIAWPCLVAVWCLTIKVAIAQSPPTPTQEPPPRRDPLGPVCVRGKCCLREAAHERASV